VSSSSLAWISSKKLPNFYGGTFVVSAILPGCFLYYRCKPKWIFRISIKFYKAYLTSLFRCCVFVTAVSGLVSASLNAALLALLSKLTPLLNVNGVFGMPELSCSFYRCKAPLSDEVCGLERGPAEGERLRMIIC
jgi:hypothetical protein